MTDIPDYTTPDEAFEILEELPENGPEYSIVQGQLYDDLCDDARVDAREAAQMARYLNRGKIEDARDVVSEVLEE